MTEPRCVLGLTAPRVSPFLAAAGALAAGGVWAGALVAQAPATSPRLLTLGIASTATAESNPLELPGAPGRADRLGTLHLFGRVNLVSPRSSLETDVATDLNAYQNRSDLDRVTYAVAVAGRHALSPRASAQVNVTASEIRTTDVLAQSATTLPLLPLSLERIQGGALSGQYLLSPATTASATTAIAHSSFSTRALAGGDVIDAQVALTHRYAPNSSAGALYQATRGTLNGAPEQVHTLLATLAAPAPDGSVRMMAQGGVSMYAASQPGSLVLTPSGGVQLQRVTGASSVTLAFQRAVSPTFGIGQLLTTDALSVDGTRRLPLRLTMHGAGSLGRSVSEGAVPTIHASFGSLDLRRDVAPGSFISVGAFLRALRQGPGAVDRGFSLSFGHSITQ